ncbi:MAG: LysR family transcriptional regulator [Methylobacter sp.]|jgi:DNA-binding transcriptional LysR family regulator
MIKYMRHMVIFSHIVETGGISAAATELKLSKSVISQQLKSLEHELGVSLLNRSTRQQVLTPAGQSFYQQCKQVNEIALQAWDNAREAQQLALGSIRISAPNALMEPIVAPAIGGLVERHEGITPTLISDDCRVDLIKDKIDLAIRVGGMPSSDYKQRKLGSFKDVLCASPGYIEKHNITSQLLSGGNAKYPEFNYVSNSWQGAHIQHTFSHKITKEPLKLSFTANRLCNSLPAVIAMAKAGSGLALIPDFVLNKHRQNLIAVLPDFESEAVPIYAVYAFANTPPTLVRLSIEAIKQEIEKSMPN